MQHSVEGDGPACQMSGCLHVEAGETGYSALFFNCQFPFFCCLIIIFLSQ